MFNLLASGVFDAVLVHSPRAGRSLANAGGAVTNAYRREGSSDFDFANWGATARVLPGTVRGVVIWRSHSSTMPQETT